MGAVGNASPGGGSLLMAVVYGIAYLTAASTIILLNKHVLSVTPFHYPIALASLGVLALESFVAAAGLLLGLFFYDAFFVFKSDVMLRNL